MSLKLLYSSEGLVADRFFALLCRHHRCRLVRRYFLRISMCCPAPELIWSSLLSIPVMAKVRIGHFVEAQVRPILSQLFRLSRKPLPIFLLLTSSLRSTFQIISQIGVDYIDESEVLTPADDQVRSKSPSSRASLRDSLRSPFKLTYYLVSCTYSTTSTSTTSRSRSSHTYMASSFNRI